ncbi:MAG: ABC transporter ATP-binding protein [Victivallales bacterium]
MTSQPIVKISDLTKKFGKVEALKKINLDIQPGRIIGLLGENGSGKSTLLRNIVGLYLPDSGRCETLGQSAKDLDAETLSRIGYVHQDGDLISWLKVSNLIDYVSSYYKNWNKDLVAKFVKDFEIPMDRRIGGLSPGEKQRISILIAIAYEPELLILDEPAAALDPLARMKFLDTLMEFIQTPNRTIIISSHILTDVEKIIDHVVLMHRGGIIRDCGFDELKEEFIKLTLSSTSPESGLPDEIPLEGVVSCKKDKKRAVLTVKNIGSAKIRELEDSLSCKIELRHLSLEEIYKIIMTLAKGK